MGPKQGHNSYLIIEVKGPQIGTLIRIMEVKGIKDTIQINGHEGASIRYIILINVNEVVF